MPDNSKKKDTAEKIWLLYFNQYLYEQGVITENERNRMIVQINERKPLLFSNINQGL